MQEATDMSASVYPSVAHPYLHNKSRFKGSFFEALADAIMPLLQTKFNPCSFVDWNKVGEALCEHEAFYGDSYYTTPSNKDEPLLFYVGKIEAPIRIFFDAERRMLDMR